MSNRVGWLTVGLILMGVLGAAKVPAADADAAHLASGKYLVERVGLCADCHSPRNEKGQFDRSKWLQGAPIRFKRLQPVPHWAEMAPRLAGLPPGWSDADAVKLLETGISRDGKPPDPPMPGYRLNHRDAVAVVAYLESLKTADK